METAQAYLEIRILAAIITKMTRRALEQRLDRSGVGLSGLQYKIMGVLSHKGQTISELSQEFMLSPSTLVPAVDALERKGLARRGRDPHDRRRTPLSLTERGAGIVASVPFADEEDPLVQGLNALGEERAHDLLVLLRELVAHMPEGEATLSELSASLKSQAARAFEPSMSASYG